MKPRTNGPKPSSQLSRRFNYLMDKDDDVRNKVKALKDCYSILELIRGLDVPPSDNLVRITTSKHGIEVMKEIFGFEIDLNFVSDALIPFIDYFRNDRKCCDSKSSHTKKLLWEIYQALDKHELLQVLDKENLNTDAIGWLLLDVIKGNGNLKTDSKFIDLLNAITSTCDNETLEKLSIYTATNVHRVTPPKHINDQSDFHDIILYPPTQEILCGTKPDLPITATVLDSQNLGCYLDWLFRLLREDSLGAIRDEVEILQNGPTDSISSKIFNSLSSRTVNVESFSQCDFVRNTHEFGFRMNITHPMELQTKFSKIVNDSKHKANEGDTEDELKGKKNLALDAMKKAADKYYKEQTRLFQRDSLVAIMNGNTLIRLGAVLERVDYSDVLKPYLIISFPNRNELEQCISEFQKPVNYKAVGLSASFFAVVHVLRELQQISSIPFQSEILHMTPNNTDYFNDSFIQVINDFNRTGYDQDLKDICKLKKSLVLDKSQKNAVVNALNNQIALIQGPPGTGKSYCGALIAKMLFDNTEESILCVCATNHALDQFLEDLMHFGIPSNMFVRIGGSKVSDTCKKFQIRDLAQKASRSRNENALYASIKSSQRIISEFELEIENAIDLKNILNHIEYVDHEEWDLIEQSFTVPDQDDGFQIVGSQNKAIQPDYLIDRWFNNLDSGFFKIKNELWDLDAKGRGLKQAEWLAAISSELSDELQNKVKELDQLRDRWMEVKMESELDVLNKRRIVGCTTSGAAKYSSHLATYNAGIVIIEEAAEILESHVITSIKDKCKHLIMIGDHQQLRPKVNSYQFQVESNSKYELNKSLFERLIENDFPHITLNVQHRMRPEISQFAKMTYPELMDADKTKNRPNVKGCSSNVIFVHHEHPEGSSSAKETMSKTNKHEVEMVNGIVKYLLQQGYKSKHFVILTPYLAQLHALNKSLSKTYKIHMNESDLRDLSKFGIEDLDVATATSKDLVKLKVSTIDNYQGEEADIVIASMVRSNDHGDIGFCKQPERINVLMTRARQGMILIGNTRIFQQATTWQPIFELMHDNKFIFPGFPILCPRHGKEQLIMDIKGFSTYSRNGGCNLRCNQLLRCNHKCMEPCHSFNHDSVKCQQLVTFQCAKLHSIDLVCCTVDVDGNCPVCKQEETDKKNKIKILKQQQEIKEKENEIQKELTENANQEKIEELTKKLNKVKSKNAETINEPTIKNIVKPKIVAAEKVNHLKPIDPLIYLSFDELLTKVKSDHSLLTKFNVSMPLISPLPPLITTTIKQSCNSWIKSLQLFNEVNDVNKSVLCSIASKVLGDTSKVSIDEKSHELLKHFLKCLESNNLSSIGHGLIVLLNSAELPVEWTNEISDKIKGILEKLKEKHKMSLEDEIAFKWQQMNESNKGMEELLKMSGLGKVKEHFLSIFKRVELNKKRKLKNDDLKLNLILMGNPGTGKTTIANCYADLLSDLNLVEDDLMITTGTKLLTTNGLVDKVLQNDIVFIDEAYQLTDKQGLQILELIMDSKSVIIMAGYQKKMEDLLQLNEGLPSRFPHQYILCDYSDDMLKSIMVKELQAKGFTIEDGYDGIAIKAFIKRVGMMKNKVGFGNVRDLKNKIEKVLDRQTNRLKDGDDIFLITVNDLMPKIGNIKELEAYKELQRMIGLKEIKKAVEDTIALATNNYKLEMKLKPIHHPTLNRLFIGNPGTGKTTVAKIYGEILKELGLLSNGEVVLKNASDFVGAVIGGSEKQTKAILNASKGKVLVIDEAYSLYDDRDPFKKAVVDTIVAEIQNVAGDDKCVLMLGYRDEMNTFMDKSNPGLARRFNRDVAFEFNDYSDDELMKIFHLKLSKLQLTCSRTCALVAMQVLIKMKKKRNFGNGGAVESLIRDAMLRMQGRRATQLDPLDFDVNFGKVVDLNDLFKGLMQCSDLPSQLMKWHHKWIGSRQMGIDPSLPMLLQFVGPPGTGKTTCARLMGEYYTSIGLLAESKVKEISASDLVGQYVGQTTHLTKSILKEALGGVLFIDEAYRLDPSNAGGSFVQESLDEIVDFVTKHVDEMVIILAGYNQDMEALMGGNSGLKSRFNTVVQFNAFTVDQCMSLLIKHLKAKRFEIVQDAEIEKLFKALIKTSGWGNGRSIKSIAEKMMEDMHGTLIGVTLDASTTIKVSLDVAVKVLNGVLMDLCKVKQKRKKLDLNVLNDVATAPTPVLSMNMAMDASADDSVKDGRDPGVDDATWNPLTKDKAKEKTLKEGGEKLIALAKQQASKSIEIQNEIDQVELQRQQQVLIQNNKAQQDALDAHKLKLQQELIRQNKLQQDAIDEQKRIKEEIKIQTKIKKMSKCVMGYVWIKQANGYRCAGGAHFLSNAQLGI